MTDSKLKKNNLIDTVCKDFTSKKIIIILAVIGLTSFIIRLNYLPFDLPVTNDASGYFWYANDLSILGYLPSEIISSSPLVTNQFPNNGWPSFLSLFFSSLDSNNFLDYMNLQRLTSVLISTLTIIPIYLLSTRFLKKNIAILAASMFAFSPRLIENSLLGNPEQMFLLLISTSLYLFLSKRHSLIVISFALVGLSALVRYEGLLIFVPYSIMFFLRFRKNNNLIKTYLIAISISVLILLPMSIARIETTGQDGMISHIVSGPQYYSSMIDTHSEENMLIKFLIKGVTFLMKYFFLLLIPMFIIFIPLGIIKFFKNRNYEKWTIIFFSLTLLVPAFYAYSRGFEDMKYLFTLYPILCIFASYSFYEITKKIKKQNLTFTILTVGIICSSLFFTNFMITDFEHEKELYNIAIDLSEKITTVNRDYEGVSYFTWVKNDPSNFPILSSETNDESKIELIRIGKGSQNDFNNLKGYFEFGKSQDMKYLVLDGNNLGTAGLSHIFENENEYIFLEKIYDSKEQNYSYHVKGYKIDYEKIDLKKLNKIND